MRTQEVKKKNNCLTKTNRDLSKNLIVYLYININLFMNN